MPGDINQIRERSGLTPEEFALQVCGFLDLAHLLPTKEQWPRYEALGRYLPWEAQIGGSAL
jgi:hypothetical protein